MDSGGRGCVRQRASNDDSGVIFMAYINQIVVDSTTYDIGAKNLVNGFTQTTAGVNALDAAAGKTLNDTKADKLSPVLQFRLGSAASADAYPHAAIEEGGGSSSRVVAVRSYTAASTYSGNTLVAADGTFLPAYTKTTDLLDALSDAFYTGSRAVVARSVAYGGGSTTATAFYYPPVPYKSTSTPSVTSISGAVTGVGSVTVTLDTSRSNRYCLAFTITRSSGTFTSNGAYLAQLNFTV